jgi:branched-chain amino acid transport system ATP-binding protein
MNLLEVRALEKRFGAVRATAEVSLTLEANEIHAVIGPNGAGKTTLIAQLAGELKPDAGSIHFLGEEITRWTVHDRVRRGLARTFQVSATLLQSTVLENVALAVQARSGHSFRCWRPALGDPALEGPATTALTLFGIEGRARDRAGAISHGERRLLELAMAVACEPTALLLDEPMAGLGVAEGRHVVARLRELKQRYGILLIEHDMDAVFQLADRITVLVNGLIIASGRPDLIRGHPAVRVAYLGDNDAPAALSG